MPWRVDVADDVEDLLDQDRRQAHRRLVQQQHARLGHQRAADGEHLLLAAGERAGHLARALLEPREQVEDALEVAAMPLVAAR